MVRIRKALVAAFGAGVAAGLPVFWDASPGGLTADEVGAVAAAFAAAAAAVGWATWRVPNEPGRGRHEAVPR